MAKSGFSGMPLNQNALLKQAQKMQREMQEVQEEMENKTWTATSGGGMVTATVNGKHAIVGLEIKPDAFDPEDMEILQDMIMAAANEAMRASQEEAERNMARFSRGLNLGF